MTQTRTPQPGMPPLVQYVKGRSLGLYRRGSGLAAGAIRAANLLAQRCLRPSLARSTSGIKATSRRVLNLVWVGQRSQGNSGPAWPTEAPATSLSREPASARLPVSARPEAAPTSHRTPPETQRQRPENLPPAAVQRTASPAQREAIMRKGMPTRVLPQGTGQAPKAAVTPSESSTVGTSPPVEATPDAVTPESVSAEMGRTPAKSVEPPVATRSVPMPVPQPPAAPAPLAAASSESIAPRAIGGPEPIRAGQLPGAPAPLAKATNESAAPEAPGLPQSGRVGEETAKEAPLPPVQPLRPGASDREAAVAEEAGSLMPAATAWPPTPVRPAAEDAVHGQERPSAAATTERLEKVIASPQPVPVTMADRGASPRGERQPTDVAVDPRSYAPHEKTGGLLDRLSAVRKRIEQVFRRVAPRSRQNPPEPVTRPTEEGPKRPSPASTEEKAPEATAQAGPTADTTTAPPPTTTTATPTTGGRAGEDDASHPSPPARLVEPPLTPTASLTDRVPDSTMPPAAQRDMTAIGPWPATRRRPLMTPSRAPISLVVARANRRPAGTAAPTPSPIDGRAGEPAPLPALDLRLAAPSVQRASTQPTKAGVSTAPGTGTAQVSSPAAPAASAPTSTPSKPDLTQITDSVYRIIRRRLATDRERTVGTR